MKKSKTNILIMKCPYCKKTYLCYNETGFNLHKALCKWRKND